MYPKVTPLVKGTYGIPENHGYPICPRVRAVAAIKKDPPKVPQKNSSFMVWVSRVCRSCSCTLGEKSSTGLGWFFSHMWWMFAPKKTPNKVDEPLSPKQKVVKLWEEEIQFPSTKPTINKKCFSFAWNQNNLALNLTIHFGMMASLLKKNAKQKV